MAMIVALIADRTHGAVIAGRRAHRFGSTRVYFRRTKRNSAWIAVVGTVRRALTPNNLTGTATVIDGACEPIVARRSWRVGPDAASAGLAMRCVATQRGALHRHSTDACTARTMLVLSACRAIVARGVRRKMRATHRHIAGVDGTRIAIIALRGARRVPAVPNGNAAFARRKTAVVGTRDAIVTAVVSRGPAPGGFA